MRAKLLIILLLLASTIESIAQPVETVLPGTIIKSFYSNNESFGPFDIGFNFTFYGNVYSQFFVSSNGLVMFGSGSTDNSEDPIPTSGTPNNLIAAFWDDLTISNSGKLLYTTIGAAPNRKLIIQGTNMGFYPSPIFMGTFLVILYEGSNKIQVQYRIIIDSSAPRSYGESATIGIENSDGTEGVQYSWHGSSLISTGQAISYTPAGSTYTVNSDELYDPIVLTSNITLPEPGIPILTSPPHDAIIGTEYDFSWTASDYAASYTLLISQSSDLGGAVSHDVGLDLSYHVTGLSPDQTYYWGVFATNATGTTWCEIKRFTTSANPPLAAVPHTLWVEQNQDKIIKLNYTGGDAGAKTATIRSLPANGQLFQYSSGVRGTLISTVPTLVTDPDRNVIYAANGAFGNNAGNFDFLVSDGTGSSPEALVTVNVSPPGIPSLLYVAKNSAIELQFDRLMANPSGNEPNFVVTVNSNPVAVTALSFKTGDPYTIIATLATPLSGTETVSITYNAGDVASAQGGWLASFSDLPVTLLAQTITFTTNLNKKYTDPPFALAASSNSGLSFTYSSSNASIATIVASGLTIRGVGTSDITARQAGNATWAPARLVRTLTVVKGDQVITFGALSPKTYGDGDFTVSATTTSGLAIAFSGDNNQVATVTGTNVHITGGGSLNITASQSGNALWNPASVQQPLTVAKASLTVTAEDKTIPYNTAAPTFTYTYSGFLFSDNASVIDQQPTGQTTYTIGSAGGTYPITLSGGSDNSYDFNYVAGTLTVTKSDQTITFTGLPERLLLNEPLELSATSTSGLTVLFESTTPTIATVTGTALTGIQKGTATIRAYNNGDANYNAAEATATVEIYNSHVNIMNLFTPNNDGINDYWELPDMPEWGVCNVKVYDRRGKLVYDNKNYDNLWDGMSNGTPVPEGAYYYIINTENNGVVKGTVNILR